MNFLKTFYTCLAFKFSSPTKIKTLIFQQYDLIQINTHHVSTGLLETSQTESYLFLMYLIFPSEAD